MECAICLDSLSSKNKKLPCLHCFHEKCFEISCKYGHTKCPLCRSPYPNNTKDNIDKILKLVILMEIIVNSFIYFHIFNEKFIVFILTLWIFFIFVLALYLIIYILFHVSYEESRNYENLF